MRMDPRERLATFSPAYATASTVEWIERMTPDQAQALARTLDGSSAMRAAADRSMAVRGRGARVEWLSGSGELHLTGILSRWCSLLSAKNTQERYALPEPTDPAYEGLVASGRETVERVSQVRWLLHDIHGVL